MKTFACDIENHQYLEIDKEIYSRNIMVQNKREEIAEFLSKCQLEELTIDTTLLNSIDFRPYSFKKLKNDVISYFQFVEKISATNVLIKAKEIIKKKRNKMLKNIPEFLDTSLLFPTEAIYYVLLNYEVKHKFQKKYHIEEVKEGCLTRRIRFENGGQSEYSLVLAEHSASLVNNRPHPIDISFNGTLKVIDLDQKINVGGDMYPIVMNKFINNIEFQKKFLYNYLEYLTSIYNQYICALIDMKNQASDALINKKEKEESRLIMDMLLNPYAYDDEELKQHIKTYKR